MHKLLKSAHASERDGARDTHAATTAAAFTFLTRLNKYLDEKGKLSGAIEKALGGVFCSPRRAV